MGPPVESGSGCPAYGWLLLCLLTVFVEIFTADPGSLIPTRPNEIAVPGCELPIPLLFCRPA